MASITLKYDARNRMAQKTLDYILSLGVFEADDPIGNGRIPGLPYTKAERIESVRRSTESYLRGEKTYSIEEVRAKILRR